MTAADAGANETTSDDGAAAGSPPVSPVAPSDSAGSAWHHRVLRLLADAAPFAVPLATEADSIGEEPAGVPADKPDLHPDPDDLIVAVGAGLRALHDLPVGPFLIEDSNQPVAAGWEMVAARCRSAVAANQVDAAALPEPYCRYSAEQLLEMCLDTSPAATGDPADVVLCHGTPVLARFLVSNGSFSGFGSLADVVLADRHFDLAVLHQSVQQVLGPEAVFRLYESYGQDPNLATLEHYVLVSHLLGTAPAQAVA